MMADQVRIVAWLRIVYSGIGFLVAAAFFLPVGGLLAWLFGPLGALLGSFLGIVLAILGIGALPGLLAGWGMLSYRPWARILNIVICFFDLFIFPMGTALAVYSLWVLFHPDTVRLFERGYQAPNLY
jgi:hypothetical protein